MKLKSLSYQLYDAPLSFGLLRKGAYLKIASDGGHESCGDMAPFPNWSHETLEEACQQLDTKRNVLLEIDWQKESFLSHLKNMALWPSLSFALESALSSLLQPVDKFSYPVAALLMGTAKEIEQQAIKRKAEGFTTAKVKVSQLSFKDAAQIIQQLKEIFRLRVDVNKAWPTKKSLDFFAQFSPSDFDYIEEPFQQAKDLPLFHYPLAVDESFPHLFSLEELASLPSLKALIYKPMIQGGILNAGPLADWAEKRGLSLVLSSTFDSPLALSHMARLAHQLSLNAPAGLGTYYFLNEPKPALSFVNGFLQI